MPKNAAIIDASILVSAFLFPESIPGQVIKLADKGLVEIHVSEILIEETRRSLKKPKLIKAYHYSQEQVESWIDFLRETAFVITKALPKIEPAYRDPNDDHVLSAALLTKVQYVVTGDAYLLDMNTYKDIQIITAKDYLSIVG